MQFKQHHTKRGGRALATSGGQLGWTALALEINYELKKYMDDYVSTVLRVNLGYLQAPDIISVEPL